MIILNLRQIDWMHFGCGAGNDDGVLIVCCVCGAPLDNSRRTLHLTEIEKSQQDPGEYRKILHKPAWTNSSRILHKFCEKVNLER